MKMGCLWTIVLALLSLVGGAFFLFWLTNDDVEQTHESILRYDNLAPIVEKLGVFKQGQLEKNYNILDFTYFYEGNQADILTAIEKTGWVLVKKTEVLYKDNEYLFADKEKKWNLWVVFRKGEVMFWQAPYQEAFGVKEVGK